MVRCKIIKGEKVMEQERIEYMRKNGGMSVKLESDDETDPKFVRRSKGEKRGVLFCGIHPDDEDSVIVGFSLCNRIDTFDVVSGERRKGFGLQMARDRALKWSNHTDYFVQVSWTENEIDDTKNTLSYLLNPNRLDEDDPNYNELVVEVPPSVEKNLRRFIQRCKRYYQDKEFPVWAINLEDNMPYEGHLHYMDARESFEFVDF
jgi:hypothetical protein